MLKKNKKGKNEKQNTEKHLTITRHASLDPVLVLGPTIHYKKSIKTNGNTEKKS